VIQAGEGETQLSLKKLTPVRLLHNKFFEQVQEAEERGASEEELSQLLGKGRAKKGMFEGDMEEGELEIGQVSALLDKILPAQQIVNDVWGEFQSACQAPFHTRP
jgi:enoyl-[acyl-carrier protein] reductase II